jgi:hypothetical protein
MMFRATSQRPRPPPGRRSRLAPRPISTDKADMAQITSREELEDWLKDKPADWAQVIAARAALRVLPYAFAKRIPDEWVTNCSLALFRVTALSWTAPDFPADDLGKAARTAADAASGVVARADAAARAFAAADAAYGAARALVYAAGFTASSAANAANAANAAYDATRAFLYAADVWANINDDCEQLANDEVPASVARRLTRERLWPKGEPRGWRETWVAVATGRLVALNQGYSVWIDWYNRRIKGERAAFDIPGDDDRTEDKKILARLADATNDDFWGKGSTYVNTTLQSWIDEARERVRPRDAPFVTDPLRQLEAAPDDLINLSPEPQDRRSPIFGTDASGRIAISAHAGAETLRTDPQAQTRHALARRMAQALGDALRGHNNAGYITGMAEAYVAAMGDRAEAADPAILVFAGDQLREAIAKHRLAGPDDDLQPLPSAADRDASGFISAHNMYAGSDPYLDDLDRTTRGPDAPLPAADPADITAITERAYDDGIVAETSHDYIVAAVAVAPAVYDPSDRHSRFASGLAQNFARYSIELLATYPDEAAWATVAAGVGALVVLGPAAAAGGAVSGVVAAYYLARNIIANEGIYRKLLGASPAGEHNFKRMIRFLKSLPIKSLKDD